MYSVRKNAATHAVFDCLEQKFLDTRVEYLPVHIVIFPRQLYIW